MTFVWPKGDLNDEQVDAITIPGNVFLTACPGSGKTRALTYKAALELSRLATTKQRVVAITYTHRAAEEIHERIAHEKQRAGTQVGFTPHCSVGQCGSIHTRAR